MNSADDSDISAQATRSASGVSERPPISPGDGKPGVALFVTCLADLMRPSVARASITLLEDAGFAVRVPGQQSCCGQPGYNAGDYRGAAAIARQVIARFEHFEYTVLPSGSCAGMMIRHYPRLLEGEWRERAERFAERVFELTTFLADVAAYHPGTRDRSLVVSYHDACAGFRELGIREQPRKLLTDAGVQVRELSQRDVCCGFGGTFCAKMPAISADMADHKISDAQASGADTLISGDLGCLLALAGRARRRNIRLRFRHVAEVLAGDVESPAIGEPQDS